jgi:tetratricopeptide (TPR) repeat protein
LKLVAGLIDAPFGEVADRERQAERQRARRRNALVTTFGLLLVLALGGLAGTWLYSRRSNELALAAIESSGEISDKAFQIIMTTDTDPSAMEQLLNFSEAKLSDLEHYGVQLDELKSRRAWVLVRFAHFFAMVKQPQKSAEYAQRAIEMARQGSSFQTQLTVNSARSALAQAKFELSDLDNAFSEASRTVEEAQSLKSSFPSEYQATVAESEDLLLLGNIQAARKNWSEASAAHITAIARLDELLGLFPDSATFPMRKAENYEALTEIASHTSDTASAARYSLEAARSRMSFLKQNVGRRAHHQKPISAQETPAAPWKPWNSPASRCSCWSRRSPTIKARGKIWSARLRCS